MWKLFILKRTGVNIFMKMYEMLILKKALDTKISDIESRIKVCQNDTLVDELFLLLEKVQNYTRSIMETNMKTKIVVGKTKADIDIMARIRGTLKRKMAVLSELIKSESVDLDIIALLEQRDSLVDEFILLDSIITKSDLEVEVVGEYQKKGD